MNDFVGSVSSPSPQVSSDDEAGMGTTSVPPAMTQPDPVPMAMTNAVPTVLSEEAAQSPVEGAPDAVTGAENKSTTEETSDATTDLFAHDIVADLPDELAHLSQTTGGLPAGVELEPGLYCVWGERNFIHTRATLPLHAIDEGIGFGLWVEVESSELHRYLEALKDDSRYAIFKTEGILANSWPGFLDTLGLPVTVRAVRLSEKVYITEVHLDRLRDALFETALLAQQADASLLQNIRELILAWLGESAAQPS